MKRLALFLVPALLLCACQTQQSGPRTVAAAGPQQQAAFDHLKTLQGKWEGTGQDGKTHVLSVFTVSSSNSIVQETMFPGMPHEMTNVYHLDGPSVLVTHYCAMGNQPHMRATGEDKGVISFHCDSVSNMTSPDQGYMGELTIAFKDKDHVTETWRDTKAGKITEKPTVIELTRAK